MKRRDFLFQSIATAGAAVPLIAKSAAPCPPPSIGVGGSSNVSTACSATTEAADWTARSTAAGVVWAHDFRSDAEVNNFRWLNGYGNDPTGSRGTATTNCRRITTDGITGGCLEIVRPAGSAESAGWWRPFSPLDGAGNGTGTSDRAANGTLTVRSWNASDPNQNGSWDYGYYGHSDYHSGAIWDGTDFYIQFRVKISGSRWTGGNSDYSGKIAFIGTTGLTPTQELVVQSRGSREYYMYTAFGSPGPLEFLSDPQNGTGNPNVWQPGGAYAGTCVDGSRNPSSCWAWPTDQWVTVLVRVVPGHGVANAWGSADNGIQVWVAAAGATSYTKIWDKLNYQMYFSGAKPLGWNAFQPSTYLNGQNAPQAFSHRYGQIIFSKQFIPCPLA